MRSGRCAVGVILLHALTLSVFSQDVSRISGKVIDAKTKEPLPFAAVYLAKTTIGVAAGIDGTFSLENIPAGKYDLTVSMLGYGIVSKSILFPLSHNTQFSIELVSEPELLDSVTIIGSKIKRSQSAFNEFRRYFLGDTRNAYSCKILNPQDVFAYKSEGKLIALSKKSIEIVNEALGYKVIYELKEFQLSYQQNQVLTSGVPRFELLTPKNESQRMKWSRERDRAYYGSFEHFIRSLLHQELTQNHFVMKSKDGDVLHEKDILTDNVINYTGSLFVSYLNEPPETQVSRLMNWEQNSTIEFNGQPITIFDNGNYEEFHNLILYGYFGWSSHVGELLPFGYQPTEKQKARQ